MASFPIKLIKWKAKKAQINEPVIKQRMKKKKKTNPANSGLSMMDECRGNNWMTFIKYEIKGGVKGNKSCNNL